MFRRTAIQTCMLCTHWYCSIQKIHIIRKINIGIRYEPGYRPALGCCILFSSPNFMSSLTTSINLLLGLSGPPAWHLQLAHKSPCGLFSAFAFLQLAVHLPVLLSTVFSPLSVPILLSQPLSLHTLQDVPTPPSVLIYFPSRRQTCSILMLAAVQSPVSTSSPFKDHLNYYLKTAVFQLLPLRPLIVFVLVIVLTSRVILHTIIPCCLARLSPTTAVQLC